MKKPMEQKEQVISRSADGLWDLKARGKGREGGAQESIAARK